MTIVSQGTIASPQQFLDLELPAQYLYFELTLISLKNSLDDYIAFRASEDDGATYLEGSTDYRNANYGQVSLGAQALNDNCGYIHLGTGRIYRGIIFPGDATFRPSVQGRSTEFFIQANVASVEVNSLDVVVAGATGRIDHIRLMGYDPANETLDGGEYVLRGFAVS